MQLKALVFILSLGVIGVLATRLAAGDNAAMGDLTPMQQLYLLKQLKPDISKVGILCELDKHPDLAESLQRAGTNLSLKIYINDTKDLREIARNFRTLVIDKQVEAIWVFSDEVLASKNALDYIIKEAVLSRIILIMNDPETISRGATLCAQKADNRIRLNLNQKSSEIFGLKPSETLAQMADIIYK